MNDVVITAGGKTWIVPANRVQNLVSWLMSNAVDANVQRTQLKEVIGNNAQYDERQLILEGV